MKIIKIRGVTLIELLIVIGIISTLSVVIVSLINPAESGRKSRDAKRISDIATLKRAIDLALSDKQEFTATGDFSLTSATSVTSVDANGFDISKYLPAIPQDSSYSLSGTVNVVNSTTCKHDIVNKNSMYYELSTNSTDNTYVLKTRLESNSNCSLIQQDGYNSNYYEVGTDPGLDL